MSRKHVKLKPEIDTLFEKYAEKRASQTALFEDALLQYFSSNEVDPTRELILRSVIERRISIPKGFTPRALWITLYMLGDQYPELSAKKYWRAAYLSSIDKTHGAILTEIQEDWSRELKNVSKDKR